MFLICGCGGARGIGSSIVCQIPLLLPDSVELLLFFDGAERGVGANPELFGFELRHAFLTGLQVLRSRPVRIER